MNQNMNNVQSNNGRGLVGAGVTAWLEEKVEESPGCVERFVCETHRTGQSLAGPAYYLMALSKYDSQPASDVWYLQARKRSSSSSSSLTQSQEFYAAMRIKTHWNAL